LKSGHWRGRRRRYLQLLASRYGVDLRFEPRLQWSSAYAEIGRFGVVFSEWALDWPWFRLRCVFFHELLHAWDIRDGWWSGARRSEGEYRAGVMELLCLSPGTARERHFGHIQRTWSTSPGYKRACRQLAKRWCLLRTQPKTEEFPDADLLTLP
jgi:hypothetical protein